MPEEIIRQTSNKVLAWLLGIIGALIVTAIAGGFKFYIEWSNDEAAEDAVKDAEKTLMFDNATQKETHKIHVDQSIPVSEQKIKIARDEDFQKEVLSQLRQMQVIDTLNADQVYQIKEELKQLKREQ